MEGKKDVSDLRILIFDDDPTVLEMTWELLISKEVGVSSAYPYDSNDRILDKTVVDLIRSGVDVVICDGKPSGRQRLSGVDVVASVAMHNPDIPVVVYSGDAELKEDTEMAGGHFLNKPANADNWRMMLMALCNTILIDPAT